MDFALFLVVTIVTMYVTCRWPRIGITVAVAFGVALVVQGLPWLSVVAGGVMMGLLSRAGVGPTRTVAWSGLAMGLLSAGATLIWGRELLRTTVIEELTSVHLGQQLEPLGMTVEQFADGILMILPSLMVTYMVAVMAASYAIGVRVFPRSGVRLEPWPRITDLRAPFAMSWTFAVALALLIVGRGDAANLIGAIGLNLVLVHAMVFYVVGLCVMGARLQGAPVANSLRGLMLAILILGSLLVPPVGLFVVGLGLFDLWYDFRKLDAGSRGREQD